MTNREQKDNIDEPDAKRPKLSGGSDSGSGHASPYHSTDQIEQMRQVSNQHFSSQMSTFRQLCKVFRKQEFAFAYIGGIERQIENDELQRNKSHRRKLLSFVREHIFVFSFQWNPLHVIYLRDMFSNWDQVFRTFSSSSSSPSSSFLASSSVVTKNLATQSPPNRSSVSPSTREAYPTVTTNVTHAGTVQQERFFCVASLEAFWKWYHKLPNHVRHFYEIVRFDQQPCFMYFDIEVNRVANPEWNHEERLISLILDDLRRELNETRFATVDCREQKTVQCRLEPEYVLDMDSSTSSKFSRHLIIRLRECGPNGKLVAFEDNVQLGQFIKQWIAKLRRCEFLAHDQQQRSNGSSSVCVKGETVRDDDHPTNGDGSNTERLSSILFVRKEMGDEVRVSAIDEGVYTKNRAFRVFLSCKYQPHLGSHSAAQLSHKDIALLRLSDRNRYEFQSTVDQSQLPRLYFEHSLVTNVGNRDELTIVVMDDDSGSNVTHHQCHPLHPSPSSDPSTTTAMLSKSPSRSDTYHRSQRVTPPRLTQEEVDNLRTFILSIVPNGFIRQCNYYEETEQLVFYIGGNKYCENIQREHKSNHVFYVVSLARGGGIYYQRCTDPDCKDFCSVERKIPVEYLPTYLTGKTVIQ